MNSLKNNFIKRLNIYKTIHSFRCLNTTKSDSILKSLQTIFGETNVSTAEAVRQQHGKDEGFYPSIPPDYVFFPQNTKQVSEAHKLCYKNDLAIIPFGAGTGQEGGVNAIKGGVCIDVSNMKKIIEVNEADFDCTVEAGLDWRSLNQYLRDTGLYFSVDPGASATIGGMAATCASGTNAVAFGTMKQNVLNLEVVLPNGQIIHTSDKSCRSRKSSAGYDLTSQEVSQRAQAFREIAESNGGIKFDYSSNPEDRTRLWRARHELFYACKTLKPNSSFLGTDSCVPISKLTDIILRTKQLILKERVIGPMFGHVGDGNFHTILLFDPNDHDEFARVKKVANSIGEIAIELCGTCTGEHGIGRGKAGLLRKQYDESAIELMVSLKVTFDPKNLMNPQKLFYEL